MRRPTGLILMSLDQVKLIRPEKRQIII
jgi:hypothetical protein